MTLYNPAGCKACFYHSSLPSKYCWPSKDCEECLAWVPDGFTIEDAIKQKKEDMKKEGDFYRLVNQERVATPVTRPVLTRGDHLSPNRPYKHIVSVPGCLIGIAGIVINEIILADGFLF